MESLELNASAGDYVRASMTMISRGIEEVGHQSTSFITENKFSFDDVSVKVVTAANK